MLRVRRVERLGESEVEHLLMGRLESLGDLQRDLQRLLNREGSAARLGARNYT